MGQGFPLIIVHGLYGMSDNWLSIGKDLADFFEVYLIDLRNHGESPHSDEHTYSAMRDDLHEFMHAQQIPKAIFMGHSMGGKTVMYFAVKYPQMVQRLIIVDISPFSYKNSNHNSAKNHKIMLESMQKVNFRTATSRREIEKQIAENIPQERIRKFLLKNVERNKKKCLGEENCFQWKLNVNALLENLENIMDGFSKEKLDEMDNIASFPVLFLKGEQSNYLEEEDISSIKKIFTHAELITVFDAGHWMHAEQPQRFLESVKQFVFD